MRMNLLFSVFAISAFFMAPSVLGVTPTAGAQDSVSPPERGEESDTPASESGDESGATGDTSGSAVQPDGEPDGKPDGAAQPPVQVVDFGEEAGPSVEMMTAQDPTPLKHESLIRKKFRGPAPGGVATEQLVTVPSRWSPGVALGGSFVQFSGADMVEDSPVGAAVGAFAEFRAARLVALHPELRLAWKGALSDDAGAAVRLGYIEVPVLVKALLPVGGATVSVGAGPSLGISLRSAVGDAALERFALSGLVDVSARTRIGGVHWLLDARYEHGLTDLVATSSSQLADVRSRVMSLGVGVLF